MSVNHPIFKAGQTKDLRIEFTLVNDGDKVIDPKIPESQIVINGKELTDSGLIFSSVQKGTRFRALSPGESLQFSLPLGDQFKEPGTYRISWKGAGFHSPEIVLRVLPEGRPLRETSMMLLFGHDRDARFADGLRDRDPDGATDSVG